MISYTLYDLGNGRVLQSGTAPDESWAQAQIYAPGQGVRIGAPPTAQRVRIDLDTLEFIPLLPMELDIEKAGLDVQIRGIPPAATVTVGDQQTSVDDGELVLELAAPGRYRFAVDAVTHEPVFEEVVVP